MSENKSKNDTAWEKLFEKYSILEKINDSGFYEISATAINSVREARLMTKFDHKVQLPQIFQKNSLTIQPNSRGSYIIGPFRSYQDLPDESLVPEIVGFPSELETIDPNNIFSEATALLCAYHSGMIANLLDEDCCLTVLGRMSTGQFNYLINDINNTYKHKISVDNSQCEIDSGFEGNRQFALIEAKNVEVSDFLIRQIYYPYRLWKSKTTKKVIPIFLSISDSIFSFYVYRFTDDYHYNSIELVDHRKYQIGTTDIELGDITEILNRTNIVPEPDKAPFPQANCFNRVIDLLTQLCNSPALSKEEITTTYAFDARQTDYYTNAGIYLGLIERKKEGAFTLTIKGNKIINMKLRERNLSLIEAILEHNIFNQCLKLYMEGAKPSTTEIITLMEEANLNIKGSTIKRRAQTVLSWTEWILYLQKR